MASSKSLYRKFVGLCLLVTLVQLAAPINARTAPKQKTIQQLKIEFDSESVPDKKFHIQSEIVGKYSSEKLTKANIPDARTQAESLLKTAESFKDNWDYGNALHHAHLVLGRVSLIEGKIDEAKRQLKLAAQTPGSPQLNSFGPNMTLAKELLEKKEKATVLEYFQDCSKFWNDDIAKSLIAEWIADIDKGKIPSFKGNLVY